MEVLLLLAVVVQVLLVLLLKAAGKAMPCWEWRDESQLDTTRPDSRIFAAF